MRAEPRCVHFNRHRHTRALDQRIEHHPHRPRNAGRDVVDGSRNPALHQQRVGANRVPHVGDVAGGVEVADVDDRLHLAALDRHDLARHARHRELRALSRADVVERTREDDVEAVFDDGAEAELLLRELADRVRTGRRDRRILALRLVRPGVHGRGSGNDDASGAARPGEARRADSAWSARCRRAASTCSATSRPHARGRRSDTPLPASGPQAPAARGRRPAGRRASIVPAVRRSAGGSDRAQPTRSAVPARCSSRWLPAKPAAPVTRTTSFTLPGSRLAFGSRAVRFRFDVRTAPGSRSGTRDPAP